MASNAVGRLALSLTLSSSGFNSGLNSVTKNFKTAASGIGDTAKKMASAVASGSAAVVAAVAGFAGIQALKDSVDSAIQFEKSMSKVKAITQATGDDFRMLQEEARRIGMATKFTAADAAKAMAKLATAGFKANEIMGAASHAVNLATVGDITVEESADIVAKIMKSMAKDTKATADVVDILAYAMANSNSDVMMLGDSFKYVGAIAKSAGKDITEVSAALMVLHDAGIQGDMAGTTLRNVLLKSANQTPAAVAALKELNIEMEDLATGKFKHIGDIVEDFSVKLAGLSVPDKLAKLGTIFETRAAAGLAAMITQFEAARDKGQGNPFKLKDAELKKSLGTADRMATEMINNVDGAMHILQSSWDAFIEGMFSTIAPEAKGFLDVINSGVVGLLGMFKNVRGGFFEPMFAEMQPIFADIRNAFGGIGDGIRPVFDAIFSVLKAWGPRLGAFFRNLWQFLTPSPETMSKIQAFFIQVRDKALLAFITAEFGIKNFEKVWTLANAKMQLDQEAFTNDIAYFFHQLPVVAVNIMTQVVGVFTTAFGNISTVVKNLFDNLKNGGAALVEFLKNPAAGFNFSWNDLLQGTEPLQFNAVDIFPPREMTSLEKHLKEEIEKLETELGTDFAAFVPQRMQELLATFGGEAGAAAANAGDATGSGAPGAAPGGERKLASAIMAGSAEALSSVNKFRLTGAGTGPDKMQQMVAQQKQGNDHLANIEKAIKADPMKEILEF